MKNSPYIQSPGLRIYFWSSHFLANLPVPLLIGLFETNGSARPGLYLGIVLTWIMGLPVCYFSPLLGTSLRWGMSFLALNQLIPILHMLVAEKAFYYASMYKTYPNELSSPLDTFSSGLIASLLFGGIWLLLAIASGAIILALSVFHDRLVVTNDPLSIRNPAS